MLAGVFLKGWSTQPFAYAVYVFSFYTLTVVCVVCFRYFPGYYKNTKNKIYQNEHANRYFTDIAYKTRINLYLSLGINILYIAVNAVSAIVYKTWWFAIFAIYYGIMALMRFLLVRYVGKNSIGKSYAGELKRSRTCSYILMTVNVILSGVVLMMIYYDRGFNYRGYLIYVMAMYTFCITSVAIRDVIKYRKYNSPVMSVTKTIKLASSMFSMLFLETAMFSQFGQDTPKETKSIMIMATGAGICVIVVSMSIYNIIYSAKRLKDIG